MDSEGSFTHLISNNDLINILYIYFVKLIKYKLLFIIKMISVYICTLF